MTDYGIALDMGTSGFRAQAIDLEEMSIVSTAITTRHPLPGANVIDHVNFAIDGGQDTCNRLILNTINKLIGFLGIDLQRVSQFAVCGNPFQLSLFQNIEIRDLAYAGERKLKALGVTPPRRDGGIFEAGELGISINPSAQVIIPPAVRHEIGADALAMLIKTDVLERDEVCLVVDYGTNAEMALVVDGDVYTGSAAAGPALEGQEIERGMLASPGAISDVTVDGDNWRCSVLDSEFMPREGDTINPVDGSVLEKGEMHGRSKGITGTGVVAAIACGISEGLIHPPKINTPDHRLHLQDGIYITEKDVEEAGKAIGAIRAGFFTLLREAGLSMDAIERSYMSGASGTYVDARKAQQVGLVPPSASRIVQVGNTSLALARDLVMNPDALFDLQEFAHRLRAKHCMFAISETFKSIYIIELSVWNYGMPIDMYNDMMKMYRLPPVQTECVDSSVERLVKRDIPDLGKLGLTVLEEIGMSLTSSLEDCVLCRRCIEECPEDALTIEQENDATIARIQSDRCGGTACRRCEIICPKKTLRLKDMQLR